LIFVVLFANVLARRYWLQPFRQLNNNTAEIMDAEDPLFILYTSGSNLKGMVHTTADIWCTQPILLKMYLIMKTTIFSGVLRILVG
jgi:acyl-coenzyme A synthetase/AMP-(fatty) acid ligase